LGGRYPSFRNAADVERRIGKGFGQGRGAAYRPWLRVQEVPSKGRSHKVVGVKVARTHHLLSDLEAACLFALEYQRSVEDIREQFPLLPVEVTQAAAALLGVHHPRYPGTATPLVLTSDFCIDVVRRDAAERPSEIAIAVKYSQDLTRRRVRELLAIEHDANGALGRRWFLFTEQSLPGTVVRNLKWLRYGICCSSSGPTPNAMLAFREAFLAAHREGLRLFIVLNKAALDLGISAESATQLFRFASWNHILPVRLDAPITLRRPLALAEVDDELLDFSDDGGTAAT
jgi:TnsA endonuclease N terminal